MNAERTVVGVIANPVSARDIRRIVAHAGNMQITDRANIVLRLLAGLGAVGIERVLIMPENSGIRQHVVRGLDRSSNLGEGRFPAVEYLDMPVSASTGDSIEAARRMRAAGVAAIIVLGGDGTHRAVVSACANVPIAGVSTGTNNAFPRFRVTERAYDFVEHLEREESFRWRRLDEIEPGEMSLPLDRETLAGLLER